MIISFSLENWMSFRDPVTFSMVATKSRQHGERVPKLGKYGARVLPIAAIYGGNASGKSNFFKALKFAKSFVVNITQLDDLIPVETFCLDADGRERPVRFAFMLLIDEIVYDFSFAVTRTAVVEERLVKITSNEEELLYDRREKLDDPEIQTVLKGTRDNQLFLTNSVSQKVKNFRPVYDWFNKRLILVAPDWGFRSFEQFIDDKHPLYATMNELLPQLDTGIIHIGGEEIPFGNIPIPEHEKADIQKNLKEGMTTRWMRPEQFVVTSKNGQLTAKKLVTFHPKSDGTEAKFEMKQESDGSRRVIDLLPAFIDLVDQISNRVYVIDEIDRSLHTLLTRKLLEGYLASCSATTRSQLLLTTHDVLLMDKQLLRHDEMWVAERDASGSSTLYSFSEYKDAAKDKDIRKSYLQGRLGGIPRLLMNGPLRQCTSEEAE
ncbi:MAG: AAA family ATPase [Candidatus Electronema sp. VV]